MAIQAQRGRKRSNQEAGVASDTMVNSLHLACLRQEILSRFIKPEDREHFDKFWEENDSKKVDDMTCVRTLNPPSPLPDMAGGPWHKNNLRWGAAMHL